EGDNIELIPKTEISKEKFNSGIGVLDIFVICGLADSKGDVRRLIQQGGCKVNETKIIDEKTIIDASFIAENGIILRSGKKKIHRVIIGESK
ncbi:MAG TPA: tyrosine--tRNA ligase, partial [Spirochaetota bacterium]|nr:tyrosine--tRNA ligase [Spirochaetota bacterium]